MRDHVELYGSPDLKAWSRLSSFGESAGAHGGVWECPDLFPMQVEGTGETKWVLIQNVNPGGPQGGSGTQYFVGDFDGERFTLDPTFARDAPARARDLARPGPRRLRGGDLVGRPGSGRAPDLPGMDEQLGVRAGGARPAPGAAR